MPGRRPGGTRTERSERVGAATDVRPSSCVRGLILSLFYGENIMSQSQGVCVVVGDVVVGQEWLSELLGGTRASALSAGVGVLEPVLREEEEEEEEFEDDDDFDWEDDDDLDDDEEYEDEDMEFEDDDDDAMFDDEEDDL